MNEVECWEYILEGEGVEFFIPDRKKHGSLHTRGGEYGSLHSPKGDRFLRKLRRGRAVRSTVP